MDRGTTKSAKSHEGWQAKMCSPSSFPHWTGILACAEPPSAKWFRADKNVHPTNSHLDPTFVFFIPFMATDS